MTTEFITAETDGMTGTDEKGRSTAAMLSAEALSEAAVAGLQLVTENDCLYLTDGSLRMCGDLAKLIPRLKQGAVYSELLVKAARIRSKKEITVLDATAGMGEDSALLAAAGFEVCMYEYDPVIAALLKDSLRRAAADPVLAPVCARMHLYEEDSIQAMNMIGNAAGQKPDVIFLDPMFPERQKSALIKKKFQLLQRLERPCADETSLLEAAIAAATFKVVIKRPLKGPWLAGRKPDYSISGKAIRYDCMLIN